MSSGGSDAPESAGPDGAAEALSPAPRVSAGGFAPGAVVRLRKPHACGGSEWSVTRVGAEIGLECRTCGRRVRLPRGEALRRLG